MPKRRRLKADINRIETSPNIVFMYDTYSKVGSLNQRMDGDDNYQYIVLSDKAMDDLYLALQERENHKQFLANKYGKDA